MRKITGVETHLWYIASRDAAVAPRAKSKKKSCPRGTSLSTARNRRSAAICIVMQPTTEHVGHKRSRCAGAADLVRLSVSGVPFVAERVTLRAIPRSMLAAMFDPESAFGAPEADEQGTVLNRDPDAFSFILGWLRRGSLAGRPRSDVLQSLIVDADYFGLDALVEEAQKMQNEKEEPELMIVAPMTKRNHMRDSQNNEVDKEVKELNERLKAGWRFKSKMGDSELPLPYNVSPENWVSVSYYTMERRARKEGDTVVG